MNKALDLFMNRDQIINILTEHNKWRRGDGKYNRTGSNPHPPNVIGAAVDGAIGLLESAWQPIETAPKDIRTLLILGEHVVIGKWDQDAEEIYEPTHWMNLPTPPEGGNDA